MREQKRWTNVWRGFVVVWLKLTGQYVEPSRPEVLRRLWAMPVIKTKCQ